MRSARIATIVSLFRSDPATSTLLLCCPLALAIGQLLNSYFNGVSPVVSIAFAIVMGTFAVVATTHRAAELRRQELESKFA